MNAFMWEAPDVPITAPKSGDCLIGTELISLKFSLNGHRFCRVPPDNAEFNFTLARVTERPRSLTLRTLDPRRRTVLHLAVPVLGNMDFVSRSIRNDLELGGCTGIVFLDQWSSSIWLLAL
jgi:hypothetical protein